MQAGSFDRTLAALGHLRRLGVPQLLRRRGQAPEEPEVADGRVQDGVDGLDGACLARHLEERRLRQAAPVEPQLDGGVGRTSLWVDRHAGVPALPATPAADAPAGSRVTMGAGGTS